MSFKRRRLKDERGQAAIFMALFVSTMILLFAFTTNIGMLVHAKINLQNAADAAAYAGAAVQARQLTAAAYLNFEMRRALKEFLFQYTVRSQAPAAPCFPWDASGQTFPGCYRWKQPGPEQRHHFAFQDPREGNSESTDAGQLFMPTTCIIFGAMNNYCQKAGVPGIPEFPKSGAFGVADPIVQAVRAATSDIIGKKILDCTERTTINRQTISAWLFNLYPSYYLLGANADTLDPFPYVDGLERLGILPRMALLRGRINNFEEALNMNLVREGLGDVTDSTMLAFKAKAPKGAAMSLDYFERPIQAFLSAKNNLPTVDTDNGNFSEITLTELLPTEAAVSDRKNQFLQNPPILAKFNDFFVRTSMANSMFRQKAVTTADYAGNCYQMREIRTIPQFPYGVTKDPRVLTYYAVRLQAKARLLFSPFGGNGTVPLKAYSAAKPFGSRIGKNLNPSFDATAMFARQMMVAPGMVGQQIDKDGVFSALDYALFLSTATTFPNPRIEVNKIASENGGFATQGHLGYLRAAMTLFGNQARAQRLAGAYAPWEIGYFTPPASYDQSASDSQLVSEFEDNPRFQGRFFSLHAPLFPVKGTGGQDLTFLRAMVTQYLTADTNADAKTLESDPQFAALLRDPDTGVLSDGKFGALFDYLISSGQVFFHNIPDPLLRDDPDLVAYARQNNGQYTVAGMTNSYKRQLTSWNNQKTAADGDKLGIRPNSELGLDTGRSGYSVRFVSFASLRAGGLGANDEETAGIGWSNPLEQFSPPGGDLERIQEDFGKLKH